MSMMETLTALRARYGATMSDDQCATLMNDAAWAHRAEGYGLSNKDGGTHGHRAGDNEDVCHDVLMLKDGTYWDALGSAGAASTPNFREDAPSGLITDPTRYWIAPIAPVGSGTGTTPQPPVTQPPGLTADQVRAIVREEVARLADQLQTITLLASQAVSCSRETLTLAEQQDRRREELAVHVDQVIVERTKGWPVSVSGRLLTQKVTLTGTVGGKE